MSPIHDQSYRHYGGGKAAPGRSWTVIAWAGIKSLIRKRAFMGLLIFAWAPFIVRAVQMYISANYPQAALQIYLSKPLMRSEYIAGKLAVLFSFLIAITLVPAMLLLFIKVMFDGNFTFLKTNLFLIPAITIGALLQVTLAAFTMLALSSLSKSARYVGILYVGITFFTSAIYGVLYMITGSSRVSWISIGANVSQVVDVVFRLKPRYTTPWQVSLLVIVALVVVSISVLERRVRGVEVVT